MFTPSVWSPVFAAGFPFDRAPAFEDFFRPRSRAQAQRAPRIDVRESEDAFTLSVEVPGVKAADIALEVKERTLSLNITRKQELPEGVRALRLERGTFSLSQTFALPPQVSLEAITADLQLGVLTVRLPKAALAAPRTIPINGAESVAPTASRTEEEVSS